MIEQGLAAYLDADAGLTALIAGRLYPVVPPEAAIYPCLTYQVVVSEPEYDLRGVQSGKKTFQFDAWGTYSQCRSVAQALRDRLDTAHTTLSDGTRLMSAWRANEIDSFDGDSRLYRVMCEYELLFVEP